MPPEATTYPKKYWWLVILVLPLTLGVIAIVPSMSQKKEGGGGTTITQGGAGNILQTGSGSVAQSGGVNILNSDLSTKMFVTNVSIIAQEYEKSQGQPLKDEDLRRQIEQALSAAAAGRHSESATLFEKLAAAVPLPAIYNNLGVEQAKAGNAEAARKSFVQAMEKDPDYAPANLNRGLVSVSQGKLAEALPDLQKAAAISGSKPVVEAVQQELKKETHDLEIEPNDDLFKANRVPLDTEVHAAIADASDTDCFQFTTPPTYRDIVRINLENRSTTLQPGIRLFDAERSAIDQRENGTGGANLEYLLSVQPDTTYYVQVYGHYSTPGAYTLTVKPLQRHDAYEPNDDILHAKLIPIGQAIEADIMDARDTDFYQIKMTAAGTAKVSLENRSTTLQPGIAVYDARKSAVGQREDGTGGANLEYSFPVQPNTVYYVQIYGHYQTGGAYTLTVTQE
jgi:tetratricopeptide (TPR) repeat protein